MQPILRLCQQVHPQLQTAKYTNSYTAVLQAHWLHQTSSKQDKKQCSLILLYFYNFNQVHNSSSSPHCVRTWSLPSLWLVIWLLALCATPNLDHDRISCLAGWLCVDGLGNCKKKYIVATALPLQYTLQWKNIHTGKFFPFTYAYCSRFAFLMYCSQQHSLSVVRNQCCHQRASGSHSMLKCFASCSIRASHSWLSHSHSCFCALVCFLLYAWLIQYFDTLTQSATICIWVKSNIYHSTLQANLICALAAACLTSACLHYCGPIHPVTWSWYVCCCYSKSYT